MSIKAFDHINIRTANVEKMTAWYSDVLGLKPGPRPDFDFPGAWLYLNGQALVHLVGVPSDPVNEDPKLEHFALSAAGMGAFRDRLTELNVPWREARLAEIGVVQLNIHDPDGNHIHVDFDLSKEA